MEQNNSTMLCSSKNIEASFGLCTSEYDESVKKKVLVRKEKNYSKMVRGSSQMTYPYFAKPDVVIPEDRAMEYSVCLLVSDQHTYN